MTKMSGVNKKKSPLLGNQFFNATVSSYVHSFATSLVPVQPMAQPKAIFDYMEHLDGNPKTATVIEFPPSPGPKDVEIWIYKRPRAYHRFSSLEIGYYSFYLRGKSFNPKHNMRFSTTENMYAKGLYEQQLGFEDKTLDERDEATSWDISATIDIPQGNPNKFKVRRDVLNWILGKNQLDTTLHCSNTHMYEEAGYEAGMMVVMRVKISTSELPEGSWLRNLLECYDCKTKI